MKRVRRRLQSFESDGSSMVGELQVAYDQIVSRQAHQSHILEALNSGRRERGFGPISKSAFNRWATKIIAGLIKRPEHDAIPSSQAEIPLPIRPATLFKLADALRSLADDLDPNARGTS